MSEKDLVKENNRLREKLNPHNTKIYDKILIYIRTSCKTESNEPVSLGVILLIIGFTLLFNPCDNAYCY
ncbi:hypothetical protein [Salinicoccus albus]|uniref:hypothetical protein n=1 Tax=Salinicoccus albus TaxID=418756 RepID=UPI000370AD15|nr:hypothetical protein [Salinicoccus albus]